jgi:hypothetical protein
MLELLHRHCNSKTQALRICLAILNFLFIFYCVYLLGLKWNVVTSKLFWIAFLVRLAAGISLGLIYTFYYSANDTWHFFEDAQRFSASARWDLFSFLKALLDFSENQNWPGLANYDLRSLFIVKIIAVFCFLSYGNYWVCASYFSLISFLCAWSLHTRITTIFPGSVVASGLAFLFFPSVIFWGSGLEKETFALCGLYFLTTVLLTLMTGMKSRVSFWILSIPASIVLWGLKYYWAVIFFISAFSALAMRFLFLKFPGAKKNAILIWTFLFAGIGLTLSFSHPNFYLSRFLEVIVSNHDVFAAISNQKNLIQYLQLEPTLVSIMTNSPWALFSGLFRPWIGEGQGLLGLAASVENFFLLALFASSFANLRKAFNTSHQVILLAAISFCVVLCIFLALSTPNFGTLSRYRIGFLSFFVFAIAYGNPLVNWISTKIGLKHF